MQTAAKHTMNIAIIGAGLIGRKRAVSLPRGVRVSVVCDIDKGRADAFAAEFACDAETDWKNAIARSDISAVLICTTNNFLSEIAAAAIKKGKHVLLEKPGARNLKDLKKIIDAYRKKKAVVMFGYNHRYHPAMAKAKQLVDSGKYGEVLFIRAKYGHGARLGYESEWRFDKEMSGGGQLLDQGCHLIDLVNRFAGELKYKTGHIDTLFWKTKLEDSAFIILKGKKTVASITTTCLEWKNVFSFEIMLKTAKIQIDGLGRSYGAEKLTLYTMGPEMGPPKIEEFEFAGEDKSWEIENEIFIKKIKNGETDDAELKKAKYVLEIINQAYEKNKTKSGGKK